VVQGVLRRRRRSSLGLGCVGGLGPSVDRQLAVDELGTRGGQVLWVDGGVAGHGQGQGRKRGQQQVVEGVAGQWL
jgi:hypothetical protein